DFGTHSGARRRTKEFAGRIHPPNITSTTPEHSIDHSTARPQHYRSLHDLVRPTPPTHQHQHPSTTHSSAPHPLDPFDIDEARMARDILAWFATVRGEGRAGGEDSGASCLSGVRLADRMK
ncbi:hypothetical protein LTR56_006169, partial [Elasticomyces elasticus]